MYRKFNDLLKSAEAGGMPAAVLENEREVTEQSEEQIYEGLERRWQVMQAAAQKALDTPQQMPAGLISGQAQKQHQYARTVTLAGEAVNTAMALALSGSEVNAAMGRICAAPTAGSCGVLPAVLLVVGGQMNATRRQLLDALLVAGGAGAVITKYATVSGAEGGCQAECGVAAAMGAAAAVQLAGGTPDMLGNAVSLALMNCMGLVCDPVAGLVQLPCSYRNASQAVNALLSADLALAGQQAVIPPDEVVQAMYRVGKQLPTELRETALGGIAATPTAAEIEQKMQTEMEDAPC